MAITGRMGQPNPKDMKTLKETDGAKLAIAQDAIKQLDIALKSLHLYPAEHVISREATAMLLEKLGRFFKEFGRLSVGVAKDSLTLEGARIGSDFDVITDLALQLFRLKLEHISIGPKVDEAQLTSLLSILCMDPEDAARAGGAVELLRQKRAADITISQAIAKRMYETDSAEDADEEHALDFTELHQLLFKNSELANAERARLKHGVFDGAAHLSAFLVHISGAGTDDEKAAIIAVEAIPRLGSLARYDTLEDRRFFFRSIAEALLLLEDDLRVQVARELLATDSAAVAVARQNVLEQLSSEELADLLATMLNKTDAPQGSVVGAIGGLSLNTAQLEELIPILLDKVSLSEVVRSKLRELTEISQATEAGDPWQNDPEAAAKIALGLDQLPDGAIDKIRAEARSIVKNQVRNAAIRTFAELLRTESDSRRFTTVAHALRGLFITAMDDATLPETIVVLEILVDELKARYREVEKTTLLKNIIGEAGQPDRLASVLDRLENDPANMLANTERYISLLGSFGVVSLLDMLAVDSSPGRRRLICRLLVSCSRSNLSSLGSKIMDHRWYLVRNVVSILGQMGDESGIPFLERAGGHDNARVRLETVRALAGLGPKAFDSLRQLALDDEKQIREEAIGAIGTAGNPAAVPFLTEIATRRDLLNRTLEQKLAAVEALGNLGDKSALPELRRLAGSRSAAGHRLADIAQSAIDKIGGE